MSDKNIDQDVLFMQKVLDKAQILLEEGLEVPVAAVIVKNGEIIAEANNTRELSQSILGHAEINAMELAAKKIGSWNLSETTLYVNLEPCPMCAGAILQSHVSRVVYAASDPKAGAFGSRYNITTNNIDIVSGVLEQKSVDILQNFFQRLR